VVAHADLRGDIAVTDWTEEDRRWPRGSRRTGDTISALARRRLPHVVKPIWIKDNVPMIP
jgi:hypothetical protein